jgi:hypothetical protein
MSQILAVLQGVPHIQTTSTDLWTLLISTSSPIRIISYFLNPTYFMVGNHDSVVGTATGYGLDDRGVTVPVPVVQTGSGVHRTSYQWVQGALNPGLNSRGVKLTTYLQLVPRSRKYGFLHPHPHKPS